jgi:ADP-heptose:LPS heptosyltransferase/GT2 family glycosyltransferase/uncharacterized coiled-coil protein SlyX
VPPAPHSIVYLRPDTIGDLVIFSSALAQLQAAWPDARHTIVVRPGYETLAPLFSPSLKWHVARFNPFSQKPSACRNELSALLGELEKLSPDLILAPTHNRTWLEAAVAAHFPNARRVALGARDVDPIFATALRLELGVEVATAFSDVVPADEHETDWENQHRLVDHLLGAKTKGPRPAPAVTVPATATAEADKILAGKQLAAGAFVAVFPAGLANVQVKAWPAAKFAELIVGLQRDAPHKLPVLLLGHASEAAVLDEVTAAVVKLGGDQPARWLGRDGEIPLLAALLARAKFYVGHDTGAMHLAAAVGRPVVGIFGGGHWPRFRPVGKQAISVVQPLPCFGCNWDCHFGDGPCVKTLTVADVRRALDRLSAAGDAPVNVVVEAANFSAESLHLIAASTPRFHALQSDRLERQHKIEELKLEADIKDGEIASLKSETDTKDAEIADLKKETDGKDGEIADLKQETDGKDVEIADLKRAATERKTEMEAIKAELEAECAEKDTEIAELKGEANTKDAEIDALKVTCNEREALIITLDGHIKEFQRMVGELNTAHGEKDKVIAAAQARVAEQTAEIERQAQELTALAPQLARLADLEKKFAALPPDAGHYGQALHDKDVHIRNVESLVVLRDREIASLKASVANYAAGHGNLEQSHHFGRLLAEKEAVIQTLHKACVEREGIIRQMTADLTGATSRVRRGWNAITAYLRLKWWHPFDAWLFKRVVEQYWMQIGILRHYAPRPIAWDRRLKSAGVDETGAPKVAIVTPSYGQERYIEETMRSVLDQNYPKLVYVVQDGGSKDGSPQIIARYADRLRAWESAPDRGQADAVHKGFAKIEAELGPDDIMAWLNSDDLIAPGALQAVAGYFVAHPEADVVYGHRIIIDGDDREVGRWIMPRHDAKALEWIDYVPQETMFWRKRAWDLAGGIDASFQFALDWDLLARFTQAGCRIVRLPYFLGAFRVHAEQKTSQAIHTTGADEMRRIRTRFHGERMDDFETINAHARRTRFRGALVARLLALGIRW